MKSNEYNTQQLEKVAPSNEKNERIVFKVYTGKGETNFLQCSSEQLEKIKAIFKAEK